MTVDAAPHAVPTTPADAAPLAPADASGRALIRGLFSRDLPREHGFEPLTVEGALPASLRGTLYRNGPGQFGIAGRRYAHPFEGDGAVTAVRFADGQAQGAARIHATAGLVRERAAGTMLYGTSAPWPRRLRNLVRGEDKNTANTSVLAWQGRLFALMEAGLPTEVDPGDLHTLGETDLGCIRGMFTAHPHRVAARAATYAFGLGYGRVTQLHLYELPDAGPPRHLGRVPLAGPPMLHDFIATPTHLVFFVSPVRVDVARVLTARGSFDDLFRWRPEHGTEVICVPIDRPTEVVRFTVAPFFQWHFANAFTRGGELVIDYVRYADFRSFGELGALGAHQGPGSAAPVVENGTLHRATIDLAARTLRSEPVCDQPCEFPTVASGHAGTAAPTTYVVLGDLAAIGAIDARGHVTRHALPAGQCITEPLHVAAKDGPGHLVALGHTPDRAFVAVYDAARIPDGPVARVWLDHHVPITFHGTWVQASPGSTT